MKTVKNILLSFLFSKAISLNIAIISYLFFSLLKGDFEYEFSLLKYFLILTILFITFLYLYIKLDIINKVKINRIIHNIIFLTSVFCFGVYGFILEYYTLNKFAIEKSSEIYSRLNIIGFIFLISAILIEVSNVFLRKRTIDLIKP